MTLRRKSWYNPLGHEDGCTQDVNDAIAGKTNLNDFGLYVLYDTPTVSQQKLLLGTLQRNWHNLGG